MKITKKIWLIIMAITLLAGLVAVSAAAETVSGSCGNDLLWSLDTSTGELTISGTGAMTSVWDEQDYNGIVTKVIVEEGVTALYKKAFNSLTQNFTISLPSTLKNIDGDFNGCTNLASVTFAENGELKNIYAWSFSGCSSLESITLPNKAATKIYNGAFNNCRALTSVTLGNKTTVILGKAFNNCSSLTEIAIPASVTAIGDDSNGSAFNGCSKLSKVNFLGTATEILPGDETAIPSGVAIHGGKDSLAETYAGTYNRTFVEETIVITEEDYTADEDDFSAAKNIVAIDMAYVRGGEWSNKNWNTINAERKAQGLIGSEYIVVKSGGDNGFKDSSYTRIALFKYDISGLKLDDIGYATFTLKFTDMATSKEIPFDIYWVDENWNGSNVTWNTKPILVDSEPLIDDMLTTSAEKIDATYALKTLVASGKKTAAIMVVQTVTSDGESRISLTRSNELSFPYFTVFADSAAKNDSYVKQLVKDEAQNKAIWDYAKQMFDEWYARYETLKSKPLVEAELILSDESQYNKTSYSPGSNPNGTFKEYKTRTYSDLTDMSKYVNANEKVRFDQYGGIMDAALRQTPTGYFYSGKIGDRWWIIDPLGYPCYIRALSGVVYSYQGSPQQKEAVYKNFATLEKWAIATTRHLKNDLYFNACASPSEEIKNVLDGLAWQSGIGFMSAYGTQVGVNNSIGGSTTFSENNTMPVFDPDFVSFCDDRAASRVSSSANSQNLLGWTLDNELPMQADMIYDYLSISPAKSVNHYSYACAWYWLVQMTGKEMPTRADVTEELEQLFRGFVWDRYYYVTTNAVKKYDSNHMILGTRFLTVVKDAPWVLRFSAEYLDCITVNWYSQWQPDAEDIYDFAVNADVPFMVTEFYAKAEENEGNLANKDGAGFFVKTQQDRGDHYQSFTLRLLEAKNCIGWHWFQYTDNDPTGNPTDTSSRDVNKGIVSNMHKEYTDLTDDMTEINKNVYTLIKYFDAKYAK